MPNDERIIKRIFKDFGWLFTKYLDMDFDNFKMTYEERRKKQSYLSINDFTWSLFNEIITANSGKSDQEIHAKNYDAYWMMGNFYSYYEGKNPNQYRNLALKEELQIKIYEAQNYNKGGGILNYGVFLSGDENCEHARSIEGWLSIDEASQTEVMAANEKCEITTRYGCSCFYSTSAQRDKDGRIVFREK